MELAKFRAEAFAWLSDAAQGSPEMREFISEHLQNRLANQYAGSYMLPPPSNGEWTPTVQPVFGSTGMGGYHQRSASIRKTKKACPVKKPWKHAQTEDTTPPAMESKRIIELAKVCLPEA